MRWASPAWAWLYLFIIAGFAFFFVLLIMHFTRYHVH